MLSLQPGYNVQRPFHFSRLTWSIISFCAVILAILFGFLTAATTAFEVKSIYTPDRNATLAAKQWFQVAPFSWFGTQKSDCEDTLITVGASYYTKNAGFSYQVERITALDNTQAFSQLGYGEDLLQNCMVTNITINLARLGRSSADDYWRSWAGTTASGSVSCQFRDHNVSFTTTIPQVYGNPGFTQTSLTGNTTFTLSANIASKWYEQVAKAIAWAPKPNNTGDQTDWAEGHVSLWRNSSTTNATSLNFFSVEYWHVTETGNLHFNQNDTFEAWTYQGTQGWPWIDVPPISASVNAFGKSLYAALLADFGTPDWLTTSDGFQYIQHMTDQIAINASAGCAQANDPVCTAGTINQTAIVNLTATPAGQLDSQYLCSVPRQKATSQILYSLVLAEVVFLQACWSLFRTLASRRLRSRDNSANYCDGCAAAGHGIPLLTTTGYKHIDPGDEHD